MVEALEYCLLIFEAFRLGHPNFEIRSTDFFASNHNKTAHLLPSTGLLNKMWKL